MDWSSVANWFLGLGQKYNVDPIVFGAIYVGAIPFFTVSVAWIVRNTRGGKSTILPILFAAFFFISAYLYLIVVGKNVPFWVYAFVVAMLTFGAISTVLKVRKRIRQEAP